MSIWNAVGSIASAGIPLIGSGRRTRKAIKQQEKSQSRLNQESAKLNYDYGEMAADNSVGRYKETADYDHGIWNQQFDKQAEHEKQQNIDQYSQAVEGVEKAGLSYGVLAGGIGGGGGAVGGGGGGTPVAGSGAGNQRAQSRAAEAQANEVERQRALREGILTAAEVAQSRAETKKTKAETDNIINQTKEDTLSGEQGRRESEARIGDITETIQNKQIQREGQRLQNDFDQIRNESASQLNEWQIKGLTKQYEILEQDLREAIRNNEIGEETRDTIINTYKQQLNNLIADEIEKYTSVKLSKRQREEIGERIKLATEDGELNERKLEFEFEKLGIQLNENAKDRMHSTGLTVIKQLGAAAAVAGGLASKAGETKKNGEAWSKQNHQRK